MLDISGLYPPIPTPFTSNEEVDYDTLMHNLTEIWEKYSLRGYVVQGSNGEVVYLNQEERVDVVKFVRASINPEKLIIAGAGCESTKQTINLCKKMAEAGANAVLVINPSYYTKAMTNSKVIINHFTQVANKSPVPVIVYNMPANTGIDIPNNAIIQLSRHPNIIGMKDSGGNIGKLAYIIQECPEFQVLAGSASFLAPALMCGAVGGVCALANIAPGLILEMMSKIKRKEYTTAFSIQKRLVEPNTAVTARWGVPGLKAAMEWLPFLKGAYLRSPLLPLNKEEKQNLFVILQKAEIPKALEYELF